ncbi:MAG: hypothetical protein CUN55_05715 [Phototrophicales bacterium]|nr:MAG: hypothetical protein CUN55_05715 [Phototrophicales bacterium]
MLQRRSHYILIAAFCVLALVATGSTAWLATPSQALAQQGPICGIGLWDTQYYNNTVFSGATQTFCTTSNQLNLGLNWGAAGPIAGVGPDNWSASFVTNLSFATAGTYRFTTTYQDGVRLYVNGQLIINAITTDVATSQTTTGDFFYSLAGSTVPVRLEYVNFTGNANVSLNWSLVQGGGGTGQTGGGNPWTTEYFNNRTFTPPSIIGATFPAGPLAVDFGFNAPAPGVAADNWSGRYTRVVNFPTGGVVNFEARADDTVTVYVNGTPVTASAPYFAGEGVVYRGSITVPAGLSTIVVEHTDIVAQAYVYVSWSGGGDTSGGGSTSGGGTTGVTSPTGVTATVNTSVLNVRDAPSLSGQRLTQIRRNEVYAVLGKNSAGTWALLQVGDIQGWSFAQYLTFSGDFNSVPVADGSDQTPAPSGDIIGQGRPVGNMRVRECPSFSCKNLGFVPWGDTVGIYGQSADGRWIKIQYVTASGEVLVGWSYKIWYRTLNSLEEPLPQFPVVN